MNAHGTSRCAAARLEVCCGYRTFTSSGILHSLGRPGGLTDRCLGFCQEPALDGAEVVPTSSIKSARAAEVGGVRVLGLKAHVWGYGV